MDFIVLFLKKDILPKGKFEADKVQRKAPQFWLSDDQKLYKHYFPSHICYAYTLRHQSYFWRSYMKGFMEATQEVDLCLTKSSLKDIGG